MRRATLGLIASSAALSGCAGDPVGLVNLNCGVAADGLSSNCLVVSESPPNQGYGLAAARSAEGTRLSKATMRNPPASGRINFVVRGVRKPPAWPGLDLRGRRA